MPAVFESRACAVLYNLLRTQAHPGPWILPANVCPIVPLTFRLARRGFELVDVDPVTLCLDRDLTTRRLREGPGDHGGVLFVRTYGIESSFDDAFATWRAAAPGALLVDDRCVCPPAFDGPAEDGPVDALLYSTGYAKPLDLGAGGYGLLRDGVAYERHEREHDPDALERVTAAYKDAVAGRRPYEEPRDGRGWLDTSRPAMPFESYRARIEGALPEALAHRRVLDAIYRGGIPAAHRLDDAERHWRFHVLTDDPDGLVRALFHAGLFAGRHYADLSPVFGAGRAPVAEAFHARVVNLFNDGYFTAEQARAAVAVVRRHLAGQSSPPSDEVSTT